MENQKDHDQITFYVNGEEIKTALHKLSVAAILTESELIPPENYRLTRDNGNHTYTNLSEEVPLHNGEKFTALFNGQTPTS